MITTATRWVLVTALVLAAGAHADSLAAARHYMSYDGIAFDQKDGQVLYRESHYLAMEGPTVRERLVLYRCADGTPFARKRIDNVFASPWLPDFDMTDARLGYREGSSQRGEAREVFVQESAEAEITRETLKSVPKDLVGDAGFDGFVQDHWDELAAGDTLRFNFLVPSHLDYMRFKVYQVKETQIGATPVRVFRLALSGLLGLVVSGIDVSYDAESRILMRFEGLSNVRDADGDNYVTRIEFPEEQRRTEQSKDAFEAASVVQLATACAAPKRG